MVVNLGHEQSADDQVGERVGNLAVGFEVGLYVLLQVNATSAWPMRWDSAFQSIFALRPAVA